MKTLLASLSLAALLLTSASATYAKPAPADVVVNGQVIGHDPDPGVRSLLARDPYAARY